jgi:hypothetical protein
MALLVYAGLDPWPVLRSRDPVFVQVAQAVAERAVRLRAEIEAAHYDALARNIGVHTANGVSKVVVPAISRMMESLARAMGG